MRSKSPIQRLQSARQRDVFVSSPQHQIPAREYLMREHRTQSQISQVNQIKQGPKYTQIRLSIKPLPPRVLEAQDSEKHRLMRDLSHREINPYEFQLDLMRTENQQLVQQVQELIAELNQVQQRCQSIESEHNPQQVEELKVFKKIYQCAQQEVQDLQYEVEHYKREIFQCQSELCEQKRLNDDMREQVSLIQTELDKQNLVRQVDQKKMMEQIQETNQNLEVQIKVRDDIIEEKNGEINRFKKQVALLEAQLKDRNIQNEQKDKMVQKYENLKEDKNILSLEVSQLQQQLRCNAEQISIKEEQYKKTMQTSAQLHVKVKELERTVSEYQQEQDQLNDEIHGLNQDIQQLEDQIKYSLLTQQSSQQEEINQLHHQIRFQKEENSSLQNQKQQLNEVISHLENEIHQFESKCNELENKLVQVGDNYRCLQGQNDQLQAQYQQSLSQCEQLKDKSQTLLYNLSLLEEKLQRQTEDNQIKAQTIKRQEAQIDELAQEILNLSNKIGAIVKDHKNQIESLNQQLNNTQNEIINLRQQLREKENENQKVLSEKCTQQTQIDTLNGRIQDLCNHIQLIESESQEKTLNHKNELDSWKEKFITLNREFHKNQENFMMLTAEFDAVKQQRSKAKLETVKSKLVLQENNF